VRSAASLCSSFLAWAFASSVHAWSDAPVCALAPEEEEPQAPLCAAVDVLSAPIEYAPVEYTCLAPMSEPLCAWPVIDEEPEADEELAVVDPGALADRENARASFGRAEALIKVGRFVDALLHLRVVERALPGIADRIALTRGDLLLQLAMPKQACDAYELAADSPDRAVAARGAIGEVRCAIASGHRKAEQAFTALLRRYPLLPERHQLSFELAMTRAKAGQMKAAVTLLRQIDLEAPGSSVAANARAELEALSEKGVRVLPLTGSQRVDRVERLLREAPIEVAAAEIEVLANEPLSAEARARLHLLSARLARLQGRWEQAIAELARARRDGAAPLDASKLAPPPAPVTGLDTPERAAAERRVRGIRGNKPIDKLNTAQLRTVFDVAVQHGMKELCDELIVSMANRKSIPPAFRFEAAMLASGLASDDKLAKLLETLIAVPTYRVSARYHHARALERLGRFTEAEAQYGQVIATDRGQTRYYAMWADLRLWSMKSGAGASCLPEEGSTAVTVVAGACGIPAPSAGVATGTNAAGLQRSRGPSGAIATTASFLSAGFQGHAAATDQARSSGGDDDLAAIEDARDEDDRLVSAPLDANAYADPALRRARALAMLAPIAAEHGAAYPWLVRAMDLIELDRFTEAADEMNEAYLAWRDASGAPRLRSGLVALMTGDAPPRRAMTAAVRRSRRALDLPTRKTLSQVARVLGDPGIGLRFGNYRLNEHPRAYAELVERAARKHGVDPNLLFAVMRVESIYNRRIISTAGAIGLMQIMPHTGRRIATKLGVSSFEPSDLLDPALNVDFSAWYLASLLKRFDGRLPLAIASYNGGPHNVRLWMRDSPKDMPLDAFLERIPFSQTHRYVRRVLTHYAAYRAQQNLPMTRLSVELPRVQPDEIAF
jgi:soluble lytic murein transglycosylase